MNKTFNKALKDSYIRGVDTGATIMGLAVLISLENVLPTYIENEELLNEMFRAIEKDLQEVWAEATGPEGKEHADHIAELLVGHVEEIRKKRGMVG